MRTLDQVQKNPYEKTHFREIAKIVVWKALALALALAPIQLIVTLLLYDSYMCIYINSNRYLLTQRTCVYRLLSTIIKVGHLQLVYKMNLKHDY